MDTHNLISNVSIAGTVTKLIVIGDGATMCSYTDRHAGTIVSYDEKHKIVGVQEDIAKRTDNYGMSDMQDYTYTPNPTGRLEYFKFVSKRNRWVEVIRNEMTGRYNLCPGHGLIIGVRDSYHDYSF